MSQFAITIRVDQSQEKALRKQLSKIQRGAPRVLARSINKTARQGRTLISKAVREEITLKARSVKKRINLTRKAKPSDLGATIEIASGQSPPSLISFRGARETKKSGVRVKVRKNEPKESFPRSFIATGKGGVEQIFVRQVKGGFTPTREDQTLVGRRPIIKRVGPSVLGVFQNAPNMKQQVEEEIDDVLLKKVRQEVNFELIRRSK